MHAPEQHTDSGKFIPPPACVLASTDWELDQEINNTPREQVPPTCLTNKSFVPNHLRTRIISGSHTAIATGHPHLRMTQDAQKIACGEALASVHIPYPKVKADS